MSKRKYTNKLFAYKGLVILFLLIGCLFLKGATAQVNIDPSKLVLEDTLNFDLKTKGILNKILQTFKFKDNRNRKERERVYRFMLNLIEKGQLNIDSATVNEIMIQLDSITSKNAANKKSIESIITKNELDKKASKAVIDSLKTQMTAVIQENANNNNQEKRDLTNKVNKYLKEIRKVQYSCSSNLSPIDTFSKGDTLYYFRSCLNPKIKVIGWQNYWMKKDEYKHYNFNYLSALNLYGYELSTSGKSKRPEFIREFEKPKGVIEYAHSKGCDIHLTVYSKMPAEITRFLNDTSAQKTLITELDTLINRDTLKGINIYFEDVAITDSKQFVQFISTLSNDLKNRNEPLQLNISVPSVKDHESLSKMDAYDFPALNPMVDYYLVLTDRMIGKNTDIARTLSPLFNSDKYGNRDIKSTIDIYANYNIPVSRLIMTVSYLGVDWQVQDFSGQLKSRKSKDLTYANIVENYISKKVDGRSVIEGFDPDLVSAFLNVVGPGANKKEQIWFEDSRSLYLKYNWALENGLGGVAIRGLGYDDGYSELWNTLGAALINIDTVYTDKKSLVKDTIIYPEVTLADYLKIFYEDFRWAVAVDLEYYAQSDSTICDCIFSEDSVKKYQNSPLLWREWQPYNSKTVRKDTGNILRSSVLCSSLYARWDIYATIFCWSWIITLGLIVVFYIVSLYFERYKRGKSGIRNFVKMAQIVFFILFIIAISFWFYLSPSIDLIGAASEGSNIGILFIALLFGTLLGWFINSWYNKDRRVAKNLP